MFDLVKLVAIVAIIGYIVMKVVDHHYKRIKLMITVKAVRPLPWWVWTTTRWGGSTTGAPFWRLVHFVNIATQIRGWWLKLRGY